MTPELSPPAVSVSAPRVSVVVPCYRYGHFLAECLDSILGQPGVDVDALIVDDASPDDSADVARALGRADDRIRVLAHDRNMGHIATYNDGLARVDGKYVVLLSADDLLAPGALARSVALLESDEDIAFVYGFPSSFESTPPAARNRRPTWTVWDGPEWISRSCDRGRGAIYNPEVVMRTDVLRRLGGYDARFPHAADMFLWLRAAAEGKVGRVNRTTQAYYRLHGQNMHLTDTAGALRDLCERSDVFEALFDEDGSALPGRDDYRQRARRSLALEAVRLAAATGDQGDSTDAETYLAFAQDRWPDVVHTRAWAATARVRAGRLSVAERRLRSADLRLRDAWAWRRWRRRGL